MAKKLKMYLLIKDWVDVGHAINSAAHAGCMIPERGWPKEDPIMKEWYKNSIRKVTCKVTEDEFNEAKNYEDWFTVTELAFEGKEVVLVFKPRYDWPEFFGDIKLWK